MENESIDKIKGELKEFIYNNFPKSKQVELTDDFDLINGKVVDSLGLLTVIGYLEEEYDIFISDDDVGDEIFKSINTIANYLSKILSKEQ